MTHYQRLEKLLNDKPYLVADAVTREVALVNQTFAFELRVSEKQPFPTRFMLYAREALEGFARLVGTEDREFSLPEIAKIEGVSYGLAYQHVVKMRLFKPSVKPFCGSGKGESCEGRFSYADAFAAGAIGALRRQGFPPKVLRKVQPIFCGSSQKTTKQTTRRRHAERLQPVLTGD